MVEYFHLFDFVDYLSHSIGCPLHFIAPASAVVLLMAWRRRRRGPIKDSRLLASLSLLFIILWLTDIPAVLGRCPGEGESATLRFQSFDPAGLIFGITSGLITFLSPCGLPPLPAYIRFFLGAKASMERSLSLSFLATSGFVSAIAVAAVVFLLLRDSFATAIFQSVGERNILRGTRFIVTASFFDALGFFAGALAMVMGVLMLLRVRFPFKSISMGSLNRSVTSVFLFSLGWGTAAIACSPFALFPLLLYAVAKGGVEPFIGYGVGMALPVLSVSLLLGTGKGHLVQKMVVYSGRLHRMSGIILLGMGVYVIIYTLNNPAGFTSYSFG